MQAFSSCGKQGLPSTCSTQVSHCSGPSTQSTSSRALGLSRCHMQALECLDFSSCDARLSCPSACGILLDQGSNLCPLYQQADSQPLDHQGSPRHIIIGQSCGTASTFRYKIVISIYQCFDLEKLST